MFKHIQRVLAAAKSWFRREQFVPQLHKALPPAGRIDLILPSPFALPSAGATINRKRVANAVGKPYRDIWHGTLPDGYIWKKDHNGHNYRIYKE